MNIYKSLNEVIEYIENNLEDKIEYAKLARILGVNEYTMKSIFSLICNMSVSEYIRKRRLSNAGFDVYQNTEKIIDIAVKYQYENATSFSRAFEKFHGMKPSSVKNNPEKLKVFAKITFNENIKEHKNMEYSIIQEEEKVLYGKGIKTTEQTISKDAPKHCQDMKEKYGEIQYGMIVYEDRFESEDFEYWVLYDKEKEGFEKYVIPKSCWIKFQIPSQEAEDIQEMSNQFYLEFLPSTKYNLRDIPELEYYHDGITEFWVPIEN